MALVRQGGCVSDDGRTPRALRQRIAAKLEEHMTDAQLSALFDEVLATTKNSRGWCPNCNKAVYVEIPDAKAVTSALMDLANQSFGTPPKAPDATVSEPVQVWEVPDLDGLDDGRLREIASA